MGDLTKLVLKAMVDSAVTEKAIDSSNSHHFIAWPTGF